MGTLDLIVESEKEQQRTVCRIMFNSGRIKFDHQKFKIDIAPLQDPKMFERVCFRAFSASWQNPDIKFVGSDGLKQNGLDIIGMDYNTNRLTGVECKNRKELKLSDVIKIIEKIDNANIFDIDHLVIAIPLPNKDVSYLSDIFKLSEKRRSMGLFTFSVEHVAEIIQRLDFCNSSSIVKAFPGLFFGSEKEFDDELREKHPHEVDIFNYVDSIINYDGEINTPISMDMHFEEWVENVCLSQDRGIYRLRRWTYLPIKGFNQNLLHFKIYTRDPSIRSRNCKRSVDIDCFDFHFGSSELRVNCWSTMRKVLGIEGHIDDVDFPDFETEFALRAGCLIPAIKKVEELLRRKGVLRIVVPNPNKTLMKILTKECGYRKCIEDGSAILLL